MSGYSGGHRIRNKKKPPSYGVSKGPVINAYIFVISSLSGTTHIPGAGSLSVRILIHTNYLQMERKSLVIRRRQSLLAGTSFARCSGSQLAIL
uniref:Uncharacterized protein n=1 Tax=Schistosoma curassoni TaxID=6186 RepID=A0A183L4Z5_9TREM